MATISRALILADVQNITGNGQTITLISGGGRTGKVLTSTGSYTGLILAAGSTDSDRITLHNPSTTNTLTFAAFGTSNVFAGVNAVLPPGSRIEFNWLTTATFGTAGWTISGIYPLTAISGAPISLQNFAGTGSYTVANDGTLTLTSASTKNINILPTGTGQVVITTPTTPDTAAQLQIFQGSQTSRKALVLQAGGAGAGNASFPVLEIQDSSGAGGGTWLKMYANPPANVAQCNFYNLGIGSSFAEFFINQAGEMTTRSSGGYFFSSTTNAITGAVDCGIIRLAAGVLGVVDGGGVGAGWLQNAAARARLTADVTESAGTLTGLSDLSISLKAGRKYTGRLVLIANNSTGAEGLKVDYNGGTATFTNFQMTTISTPVGATIGVSNSTAVGTALTFTAVSTTDTVYEINLTFVCNAAGTFIPRIAENSHTSGTATFRLGSYVILEDMPN